MGAAARQAAADAALTQQQDMQPSDTQQDMQQSGSDGSGSDSSGSDSSDDEDEEIEARRAAAQKAAAPVALPSAADLMSGGGGAAGGGGGGGIYHNPYEQQELHSKRKMVDGDDTIFKKVTHKKKVYGQGAKPKTNSSVAKSWTSGGMAVPPQVARGRANTVTEDTAAWNVKKGAGGMYSKQFGDKKDGPPLGLEMLKR